MSLKIRQQFNRVFGETREYDLHSLVFNSRVCLQTKSTSELKSSENNI